MGVWSDFRSGERIRSSWWGTFGERWGSCAGRQDEGGSDDGADSGAEAEKLYAEAVKLYKKRELHDVKPPAERLQSESADAALGLDAARQPPLGELIKATAKLGRRIVVRQTAKAISPASKPPSTPQNPAIAS